jgi:hypothetical protein
MNGAPVELSVCIGGAPLRSHSLPPGEFVVAQPGSAFTIKLKNVWHDRISVEVKVDGQWTGSNKQLKPGHERVVQGFRMQGGNQAQQFVFAYPPTFEGSTSAAPLPGTSAALGALGSITATAWPTQPKSQKQIMKEARSGIGPSGVTPEQQAVPEGKKALALGVTVAAGSTVPTKWKASKHKSDKSGANLGKVELRYCVPDALKLSNDPALKAAADALIAAGPDPAAGAAAAGAASSSSAAAASSSAPLNAAASGNAPASADVKPERKRRGKAKASSATPELIALDLNDAPPKRPKIEPPPSNTADAPIDLT